MKSRAKRRAANADCPDKSAKDNPPSEATHYVIVDNVKVPLTAEEQKAWNQMIYKVRRQARRNRSCGQSDYRLCEGDCETCKWYRRGKRIDANVDYLLNSLPQSIRQFGCTRYDVEGEVIWKLTRERIYSYAKKRVPQGDLILRLYAEDGMKIIDIGRRLHLSREAVRDRLYKVLDYLRSKQDKFF